MKAIDKIDARTQRGCTMRRKTQRSALVRAMFLALVIPLSLSAQAGPDRYEVGRALPPLGPGETLIEMTIDDAIARALEMNLDIQTARLNPDLLAFTHLKVVVDDVLENIVGKDTSKHGYPRNIYRVIYILNIVSLLYFNCIISCNTFDFQFSI